MRDAVAHGFDEDWFTTPGKRHLSRFFGSLPYRKNVIAVYADGIDAIANTSTCDAIASVLLQRGRRNCVPIITADEHRGARPCGGNIERSVEVPFAGSALAEIADYDTWDDVGILKALQLKGVRRAGRLRDLCGERGGDGVLILRQCNFGWKHDGELTMFSF
jgi:hypothetical protein